MSEEDKKHIDFDQYAKDTDTENYLIGLLQRNQNGVSRLRPQTVNEIISKLASADNRMKSHQEAVDNTQPFNWLR